MSVTVSGNYNRNVPAPDSPPVGPSAATPANPSNDGPPSPPLVLAGSPLAIARRARRQSSIASNNAESAATGGTITQPSPHVISSNTSAASRSLGIVGSAVGEGSGSASPVGSPAASLYGHPLRPPSVVNGSFGARSAAALGVLPQSHSGAGLDSVAGASTSLTGPLQTLMLGVGVDAHLPLPVMHSPARQRSSSDFGGTSAHAGALSASLSGPGSALASPGILRPTPMPQPLTHTAGHPGMASSPPGTRPVLLGPLFETSGDEAPLGLMSIAFHRSASQQSTHSSGAPLPLSALDGKHRRRQGAGMSSCSSVVLAGLESSGRNDHWQGLSTDPTPTHVIDGDAAPPPAHRTAFSVRTGSEEKGRAGADTATTSGSGDTTDKSTEPPSPWSPAHSACPSPLFTPPIVPSQPLARRNRAPALSPLVWGMPLAKPPPSPGGDKAHRDSGGPASPGARSVMSVGCRPSALAAVPTPVIGALARSQSCHSLDESSLDSTVITGTALDRRGRGGAGPTSKASSHRTSTGNIEPRTSKGNHGSASAEQPLPHASRQISDSYGVTQSGSHSRTTSPSPPVGSAASPSRLVRQLQRQRFPLALSQAEMEVRRDGGTSQTPQPSSASRTATSSSTGRVVSASTITASPSGSGSPGPLKASTALAEDIDAPRIGVLLHDEDVPPSPHSDSRGSTDSRSQYEALFSQTVRTIDDDSVVGPTGADSPPHGALSRQASSVDVTRLPPPAASVEDDEAAMHVLTTATSRTANEAGVDRGSRGQEIDSWMHDTHGTTSHGDDSEASGTTGKDAQRVMHPSATGSPHAAYSSVTGVSVAPSPRTSNASNAPSMPQPVSLLLTASSPPPPQLSLPMHAEDGGGGAAGGCISISSSPPAHGGLPPPPPMLNETMLANMHASVTPRRGQAFFPHSGGFEGDSLHSHDRPTAPSATDVDACTPRSLLAADSFVGARGSESFRGLPRLYSLPPDQREDNIIDFSLAGGGSSCALLRGHPPIPSFTGGPMQPPSSTSTVPKPRCVVTNISGPEGQRAPQGRVTAAAQAAIAKVSALTGSLVDHDVTSEGDLSDDEGGSRTAATGRPFGLPRRRISHGTGHTNAGAESLDAPTAEIRPPLSATASSVCPDREPGAPQDAPLRLMSGRTPTPSRGGLLGPGGDVFRIDAGGASGSSSGAMMGGIGAFQSISSHQHMLIPFGSFSTASASAGGPHYNHSHSGGTRSTSSGLTAHRAGGVAGILTSAWNTSLVLSACSLTHSHSNSSGSNAPTANYLQQQGVTAAVGLRSGSGPSHTHISSLEHVETVHSGGAAPNSLAAGQRTLLDSSSCTEAQVPPPASRSPPQQLPNFSILGNNA